MFVTKAEQNLVSELIGSTNYELLHPSLMYTAFTPFWRRSASSSLIEKNTSYDFINNIPSGPKSDQIVTRFYRSSSFNVDVDEINYLTESIAQHFGKKVVNLYSSKEIDDHANFELKTPTVDNIDFIEPLRENLKRQFDVIRQSNLMITNYGGLSYFGVYAHTKTLAVHNQYAKFLPVHLDISNRMDRVVNAGLFSKLDKSDQQRTNTQLLTTISLETLRELIVE